MRPLSLALMAVLPLAAVPAPAAAQPQPEIGIQVRFDVSPPLSEIPPVAPEKGPDRVVPNLRYYSGDNGTAANRPQLVVTYQ
ncbi:MAG TPA: hypothetical protein VNJ70_10155 [Thermoanaerobaculia bacterium]|nr:hypothetical protein [Thermoanaerobaculia bacterium]